VGTRNNYGKIKERFMGLLFIGRFLEGKPYAAAVNP